MIFGRQGGSTVTGNYFDGSAHAVAQAGHVEGGIHFYAPSRPAEHPPRQVPQPTRSYTNNERQLRAITEAVRFAESGDEAPRVVVVRGPVGGGKSETAFRWVAEHGGEFAGRFYARLSGTDGESGAESEALREFLIAVGYTAAEIPATVQGRSNFFRSWSSGKNVVVVVDDAVTAAQVRWFLPGEGRSVVLVTEAGPLGALRQREKAAFVELDPLSPESSRLLLRRILPADDPRPESEPENVDALVDRCEGSTLALCVAGALLADRPQRPVDWLVRELAREDRRLAVLSRDESLSMTAVLNTAVDRLDERARLLYAAFGQHPGSGDVGVPAFVAALGEGEDDVRDGLDRLVDARLVQEGAQGRFFVDGLVRAHARRLGADPAVRAGFLRFYLDMALPAGNAVMPQRGWLERIWPDLDLTGSVSAPEAWLEAERANLRAVAGLLREDGDAEVCRLAVALWPFHERAKHLDDMDAVNEHAVAVADHGHPFAAGLALVQRGFAFRHRGEWDKAAELFARAERIAHEQELPDLRATAVESLGIARREQGDREASRELLRRNLDMAAEIDDQRRTALAKMHLGAVEHPEAAVALLDEAIEGFRSLSKPDVHNEHKSLLWRGIRSVELHRLEQANTDLRAALRHMTEENRQFEIAQIHHALGVRAVAAGAQAEAREHLELAESIHRSWGFLDQAERILAELGELRSE
ncbi:tetratricopeptide repeat protein [Saccharopolyspora sp. NFXS83]|uniref:tetratricopeptide repeat protein n=1 Tax=Saccharopolyspora sp. NFXS83 TaxID=2993560 RepID=UPI00224B2986|nr:tetratricopeptide repeat protein [Saccharopolyspora sp. NFXS83]MCX2729796.1 tetratricopeptide repeat protein [Saccharopolyspora sp. NFXS83]